MPFYAATSFERTEADGLELRRVDVAVAQFSSSHPYLLFDRAAIGGIRRAAGADPRLEIRFIRALSEVSGQSGFSDIRTIVKHRARRLITAAFVALIAEGSRKKAALAASRNLLSELSAAVTWKERPIVRSFLDCAETAIAVALAYDWLYEELSTVEREEIERALVFQIVDPALAAYADQSLLWHRRRDNCCLVSNCGITLAALAVLRRRSDLVAVLLQRCLASTANALAAFAPDGAWPEGPSYWSLAVRHAGLMIAALESTLGDSFGLADRPGIAATGDFALHTAGPSGEAFDFGDSFRRYDSAALAWLAYRFRRPIDGWLLGDYDGWHLPYMLIWLSPAKAAPDDLDVPTGKVFRGVDLACFRNTWRTEAGGRPVYLAIKGGNSHGASSGSSARPEDTILHAQADAGSFIVDGAKVRWVMDLGGDDYDLPGYFDHGADRRTGPRWQYYRVRTSGHNTLVIDGLNQDPRARAKILGSSVEGGCKWIVYDLSAVYGKPAGSIRRGAALIGRQVVISDEIDASISGHVVWTMHTSAEPLAVTGSAASFRRGRDRLVARILEPASARFELTLPPAPRWFRLDNPQRLHGRPKTSRNGSRLRELPRRDDEGERRGTGAIIRRLQIRLPPATRRLTVMLLPDWDAAEDVALPVAPLDNWLARRPVRLAPCLLPHVGGESRRRPARNSVFVYENIAIGACDAMLQTNADHG